MGRSNVLAILHPRRGVGKTTIAVNLAATLVKAEHWTVLIDLDPESDASRALGVDLTNGSRSIAAVIRGRAHLREICIPTASGIDLVPAHLDLAVFGTGDGGHRASLVGRLSEEMDGIDAYAFAFLDCPSGLNALVHTALALADQVLIPYQTDERERIPEALRNLLSEAPHPTKINLIANKVIGVEHETDVHENAGDLEVSYVGAIRYSPMLQERNALGLPPVILGPEDEAAKDFAELAAELTFN